MDILLIAVVILLYSFQTLFQTSYTKTYPGKPEHAAPVFCVLESLAIVLVTLCFTGFRFPVSPETLVIGLLNAGALFGYNTALMKAGTTGSYAFMNVMMLSGGILIPMVYLAFLGIYPSWYQYLAIAAMLAAFVLMNLEDFKLKDTPAIYYVMCVLLFCFNGLYGTFIKMQDAVRQEESKSMIIITFGIMGLIAFIRLILREKKDSLSAFKIRGKNLLWLILCIISAALAINVLVLVVALMENTAVLYTLENGGVLLLSALYSIFIFKEKPSPLKIAGILLAAASMIVLSIPR